MNMFRLIFVTLLIKGVSIVSCANPQKEVAVISTKFGDMVVEFFEEAAPKHVESFKLHAESGYYNGTIFHRVIPGFVIQGGDPNTKGDNKATSIFPFSRDIKRFFYKIFCYW